MIIPILCLIILILCLILHTMPILILHTLAILSLSPPCLVLLRILAASLSHCIRS